MCFIIICHIFQYFDIELAWWFNVGVQIFLCVSGYLYSNKEIDTTSFLKKNFIKILSGYYVVVIPFSLISLFVLKNIGLKSLVSVLLLNATLPGGEHLWFVPTILCCYFLTPFLYAVFSNKDKIHINIFIILSLTFVAFKFFVPYFNAAWISCYIVGYYLGKVGINKYNSTIIILLAVIANGIQIISDYIMALPIPLYSVFCNYAHTLLGVGLFIILKYAFIDIKGCRILRLSDKYSYHIYLVHQFFVLGPLSLMQLTKYTFLNISLMLVAVVLLAVILKKISDLIVSLLNKKIL